MKPVIPIGLSNCAPRGPNVLSRRRFISTAAVATGSAAVGGAVQSAEAKTNPAETRLGFGYCLNTGTIRGQKLSFIEELDITAKAGYDAIEPWIHKIHEYKDSGGSLKDLKKQIVDLGITVESAIGFARWIVDDDDERARGVEQFKRDMDVVAQIGGKRVAAPPAGASRKPSLDLDKAAGRYRAILEIGDRIGIIPQLETWGHSKNLHRIGQALYVIAECGHPKACLLLDVFHTYKGGSDFNGYKVISGRTIQVFHMNDYPADPPRETIGDRDRVMPGDGIAPIPQILRDIYANGCRAMLSLELFNPGYWKQDALAVAKLGLAKMKAVVQKALA
ncbi:MAG: sugar phosphate isomerase/epimerase [Planctomycetes bacterium]|nr:sugar phosphate isomerase/epimerase [Planctomycetota bacterium]